MSHEHMGDVKHGDVLLGCGCMVHRMFGDIDGYPKGKVMKACPEHAVYVGHVLPFSEGEPIQRLPKK
jgi:hypothetical protein